MQLSNEAVIALIAIAGTVASGTFYILKRKADAALEHVRAEKRESDARAEQVELDAQARLRKAEADAEARKAEAQQAASMLEMMNKQIVINRQQQRRMDAQKASAEEGYKIIRGVQDDMNRQLTNMYNAIRELKEATLETRKETIKRLDDLPQKMHSAGGQMLGDFAKTLAGEMAVSIAEQFERQRMETTLYPFPNPDDPDWREELVKPTASDVTIRKEPLFWDNALLQKPCAKIAPEGERLKVITGRTKDWVIVDKMLAGERCWGWLKAREVQVGEPVTA